MRQGTLKQMQAFAKERGGKCLSTAYGDAHTKLQWQCQEGHEWEATPGSIKSGRWCPECARAGGARTLDVS